MTRNNREKEFAKMKRSKVKFEQIHEKANCKQAIISASKNKRRRKAVQKVLANIDLYAEKLSEEIKEMLPNISGGTISERREGIKQKLRKIAKPRFFPDQCVHWAFMQILEPVIDKRLDKYSYSSVKKRGIHYAKNCTKKMLRSTKHTKYAYTCDIHHCYPEIDKEQVIAELVRVFKDKRITDCMAKIIRIYPLPGIPLGWRTSSPLANLHLARIDRFLREDMKMHRMGHYMDNYTVLHANKKVLHKVHTELTEWTQANLNMTFNADWQVYKTPYKKHRRTQVRKERGRAIDAYGFKFYRYKTTIRKAIYLRIKQLVKRIKNGAYTLSNAHSLMSRLGYFKHTDSKKIRKELLQGVSINKLKEIIRNEAINFSTRLYTT